MTRENTETNGIIAKSEENAVSEDKHADARLDEAIGKLMDELFGSEECDEGADVSMLSMHVSEDGGSYLLSRHSTLDGALSTMREIAGVY